MMDTRERIEDSMQLGLKNLRLSVQSGAVLDVRHFAVRERMNELFTVDLVAVSRDPEIDFEGVIGRAASFEAQGNVGVTTSTRRWAGVCAQIEQVGVEADHLSTYQLRIVPRMWLMTQRRNYSIFQQASDLDVVLEILAGWSIEPRLALDPSSIKARRYRSQYAESDFAFASRLLEDSGIAFFFEPTEADSRLVLADAPNRGPSIGSIAYHNVREHVIPEAYVTNVRVARRIRPGKYTQRDVDYRRPAEFPLQASASAPNDVEARLERFHHNYGAFVFRAAAAGDTPVADDRGAARCDLEEGARQVARRLDAKRGSARVVSFETVAHELGPGSILAITGHPRKDICGPTLIVIESELEGTPNEAWLHRCEARFTDVDFRPELDTPKPRTRGVESATVVGPKAEDIHTDEFGRVRVQFHWDRVGARDEQSSCWIPVSQPWGGSSFGAINLPRVGQEVLVDFLGADPDRPVVIGRVFTQTQPVPYKLPQYKNVSGIRSESTPRMVMGASGGSPAVAAATPAGNLPATAAEVEEFVTGAGIRPVSPDRTTHRVAGNELTFDDTRGQEINYLQAQRDLNILVKNAEHTFIGNYRDCTIWTNDTLRVGNEQRIKVESNRFVAVAGNQHHEIKGDVVQIGHSNQVFKTDKTFASKANEHVITSETRIELRVKDSRIVILPDAIVIQSDYVFINPGQYSTARPQTPQEISPPPPPPTPPEPFDLPGP